MQTTGQVQRKWVVICNANGRPCRQRTADSVEKVGHGFHGKKYALEIEIFSLSRGFRAQISRGCAQKRRFQQSIRGQSGRTDFFNTIGQ